MFGTKSGLVESGVLRIAVVTRKRPIFVDWSVEACEWIAVCTEFAPSRGTELLTQLRVRHCAIDVTAGLGLLVLLQWGFERPNTNDCTEVAEFNDTHGLDAQVDPGPAPLG